MGDLVLFTGPRVRTPPKCQYALYPGSEAAHNEGCSCAQIDNHYGAGINGKGEQWFVDEKCPLHGGKETN